MALKQDARSLAQIVGRDFQTIGQWVGSEHRNEEPLVSNEYTRDF